MSLKAKIHSMEFENKNLREKILEISEKHLEENLDRENEFQSLNYNHFKKMINLMKDEKKRLVNELSILNSEYYSNLSAMYLFFYKKGFKPKVDCSYAI